MKTQTIVEMLLSAADLFTVQHSHIGTINDNYCVSNIMKEAAERLEELDKKLAELESGRSMIAPTMEWISVEDRLPEEDGSYAVICDGLKKVYVYYFESKSQGFNEDITHWMPLPEPPKPKEPTFKDVFLDKFPKTPLGHNGAIKFCARAVFSQINCSSSNGCVECWNQPYFEEEGEGDA